MAKLRVLAETAPDERGGKLTLRELRDFVERMRQELYFLLLHLDRDNLGERLRTELDGKQDTLTFDRSPSADSRNPVTSEGILNAIRDRETVGDSIFSTVTEITSGGITITPTDGWTGYSYLAITLNTAANNPAASRMVVVAPVIQLPYNCWYPAARDGVYGAVRVGTSSGSLTLKTDITPLYVANVRRVR